ncbi:MAG: hypothetical protein JW839_19780, partial [Candidatus Lokiarchaeota archaeon]|nr:hypothetical protein [Candidatus Lokiarchaeota archaeon]
GAVLAMEGGAWHGALSDDVNPDVVDTVGAGDAFLAGMIHAMLDGTDPPGILVEAVSCATAKLLVHGAGTFSAADRQRFVRGILVRRLA